MPRLIPFLPALLAFLAGAAATPAARAGGPPVLEGQVVARLSVTLARRGDTAVVPGPFAVLPDGRVAVDVPESDGILLVQGDRILHHFPLPSAAAADELAASGAILVAGHRPRGGPVFVDLTVFDVQTGRFVERVESSNPYLRPPAEGRDRWRIVVEETRVGVFEPTTAATYPLWDRDHGFITGSRQVVESTAGLGFGARATWIPNPDGSVDRKVRGRSEPFAAAGEGEFVGSFGDDGLVLLESAGDPTAPPTLPREIVVHLLQGDHAISELRLAAVSSAVEPSRLLASGRFVQVQGARLYWTYAGPDYLEIRAVDLPASGG